MTWVECLRKMRTELQQMGYDQIPELTSSRLIDVNKTMHIVPSGTTGRKRAILIGINYTGQQGQLVRTVRVDSILDARLCRSVADSTLPLQ